MTDFFQFLDSWLQSTGMTPSYTKAVSTILATLSALLACVLFFWVLNKPLSAYINRWVNKSSSTIDDVLLSPKVVASVSMLATTVFIGFLFPSLTFHYPGARNAVVTGCRILNIASVTYLLILETNAFCQILRRGNAQRSGVLVIRNILETVIFSVAALIAISTLLNRDVAYVVSALGAMAAVLMLVFRDSILGMIAGIRLSLNGILKENDWVVAPKYNADGRVEDISLTSVKIRNWDKSISTVPPYALMSEGFVNKQRMLDLGIRQIRRTFYVDINSIRRLDGEEIGKLREDGLLCLADKESVTVNLSLFRRWLRDFMLRHPRKAESSDKHYMQVFVRELPSTPNGLPVEVFFFVDCIDWEEFEQLQADFIDEVTAAFPLFGLRLFQTLAPAR